MHSSIFGWLTIILKRDLLIAFRKSSTYITPLVFFLIVVTFFPLALGPQESLLSSLAPGVIWIAALLASLLAVETIFSDDFRDGTLDEFFISLEPSFILVFAKVLIHWLITGLPILFASLIAAIVLYLPFESFIPMLLSLILGTSFMKDVPKIRLNSIGIKLSKGRYKTIAAIKDAKRMGRPVISQWIKTLANTNINEGSKEMKNSSRVPSLKSSLKIVSTAKREANKAAIQITPGAKELSKLS